VTEINLDQADANMWNMVTNTFIQVNKETCAHAYTNDHFESSIANHQHF